MTTIQYIHEIRKEESIATGSIDAFWELHRQELDHQKQLAKQSQLVTHEIGTRKVKMRLNTKGWQRNQYFNKLCLT